MMPLHQGRLKHWSSELHIYYHFRRHLSRENFALTINENWIDSTSLFALLLGNWSTMISLIECNLLGPHTKKSETIGHQAWLMVSFGKIHLRAWLWFMKRAVLKFERGFATTLGSSEDSRASKWHVFTQQVAECNLLVGWPQPCRRLPPLSNAKSQ